MHSQCAVVRAWKTLASNLGFDSYAVTERLTFPVRVTTPCHYMGTLKRQEVWLCDPCFDALSRAGHIPSPSERRGCGDQFLKKAVLMREEMSLAAKHGRDPSRPLYPPHQRH